MKQKIILLLIFLAWVTSAASAQQGAGPLNLQAVVDLYVHRKGFVRIPW